MQALQTCDITFSLCLRHMYIKHEYTVFMNRKYFLSQSTCDNICMWGKQTLNRYYKKTVWGLERWLSSWEHGYSSGGLRFNSQHAFGLQLFITQVPGGLMLPCVLHRHQLCKWYTDTHVSKTLTNIKNLKSEKEKKISQLFLRNVEIRSVTRAGAHLVRYSSCECEFRSLAPKWDEPVLESSASVLRREMCARAQAHTHTYT